MSKVLKLLDGTTMNVDDSSTATSIVIQVKDFAEVDEIRKNFTKDNAARIELEGIAYHDLTPRGINVAAGVEGTPTVTFSFGMKTDMEVLLERIDECEEMINALLMN